MRFIVLGLTLCLFLGCGGSAAPPEAAIDLPPETPEIDRLIAQIDKAKSGDAGAVQSVGLYLQESVEGLREAHPDKGKIIDEINQLGAQMSNTGNKALLDQAKAKLQEMK